MSSTKRGSQRSEADNYPTPYWAVKRFLEKCHLPGGRWLEPGGGSGNIIRAVNNYRNDVTWTSVELREDARVQLVEAVGSPDRVFIADYLDPTFSFPKGTPKFDVAFGNPPFRLAMEFIERSFEFADRLVLLLRLNFLGSEERNEWMKTYPPDQYILPNRPSFRGQGSDSIEYSWMTWENGKKPRIFGLFRLLDLTPLDERKKDKPLVIVDADGQPVKKKPKLKKLKKFELDESLTAEQIASFVK